MIFIPFLGTVMAILTFPGVILHEIAHRFFCDVTKTPVLEVKYFGISQKNTFGHVIHKQAYGLRTNILIDLGPFIINNLVACFLATPLGIISGMGSGSVFEVIEIFLIIGLMWLSFSCAYNSFPSSVDVSNLTDYINGYHSIFIQTLYLPFRLIFFIQRILSIFWFDAIWAFVISIGQIWFWSYVFSLVE